MEWWRPVDTKRPTQALLTDALRTIAARSLLAVQPLSLQRLLHHIPHPHPIELRARLAPDATHRLGVARFVFADHALAVARDQAALPGDVVGGQAGALAVGRDLHVVVGLGVAKLRSATMRAMCVFHGLTATTNLRTLRDIQATLGLVPGFFRAFPEAGLPGAWADFNRCRWPKTPS